MIKGNIPDTFEKLSVQQREEFAKFGFKIFNELRRDYNTQEILNAMSVKIDEDTQRIQRALNQQSCKVL